MKLLESVLQQNEGANQKEEDVTQGSRDTAQRRSAGRMARLVVKGDSTTQG